MSQQTFNTNDNPYVNGQTSSMKPLQISEAIWQLPRQFIKVIFRPSAQTFREELSKASWGMVLIQFYMLVVITVALTYLAHIIPGSALHTTSAVGIGSYRPFTFLPSPYNGITFILASFLIGLITAYLFSRLWRGQGRFVTHTYGLLLCTVPLVTISGALLLIPASGSLVALLVFLIGVLFVYRFILHGCIIIAAHGLSAGKATVIVLIIPMIFVVLGVVGILIITGGEMLGGLFEGLEWLPGGEGGRRKKTRTRAR
jgi:Yip1 domain